MEELKPEKRSITLLHKIKAAHRLIECAIDELLTDEEVSFNKKLNDDLAFFYGIAITYINNFRISSKDYLLLPCVKDLRYDWTGGEEPFELAQNCEEAKDRLERYKRVLFGVVYWADNIVAIGEGLLPQYNEDLIKNDN